MSKKIVYNYNINWLKDKGFFEREIAIDILGKTVKIDEKNLLAYVEVFSNEEVENIKKQLASHKINFIWFFFPEEDKLKVYRRFGEVRWFYFSPKLRREYIKSKLDKLRALSPDTINSLFDIKDIVNKFYLEIWRIRLNMAKSIKNVREDSNKLLIAQRFIDRMIFFYFLSQLGLVKIKNEKIDWKLDRTNTRRFFNWIIKQLNDDYSVLKFMNRIFFGVLSKVNESGWSSADFTIENEKFSVVAPSLNGGLFTEESFEGIKESDIKFRGTIELINYLNKYNWIIGEEIPYEDAIGDLTPEIIGHIYEKFVVSLEQLGKSLRKIKLQDIQQVKEELKVGRKKIGAYYTPEEITNYISINTIYPYIKDRLKQKFGDKGIRVFDNLFKKEIFDPKELEVVKFLYFEILSKIKICDNACGSGSFLIAAGDVLLRLYSRVLKILEDNLSDDRDVKEVLSNIRKSPTRNYYIVRQIIVNNLYGVDIMEGAVEIAKLRFWLWLISQVDPRRVESKRIETLPNLDFNLMVGNSLIGFVDIGDVEFDFIPVKPKERWDTLTSKQYLITTWTDKDKVEWLKELAKQKQKFKTLPAHEAVRLKEELNEELDKARKFLNEKFYNMLKSKGIKISKREFLKLNPFHWGFEFYEVFDLEKPKEERGFDVIIGNPPYGNILSDVEKDIVKVVYPFKVALTEKGLKGSHNSAAIFIERSYSIMNHNGKFSFIVPNTIARKDEFQKLRWFILNQTYCYELADVGNPFKHSGVNLEMIIIFYGYAKHEGDYKIKILSKRSKKLECTKVLKSKFEKIGWFAFYYDEIFAFIYEKIPKINRNCNFEDVPRPYQLKVKLSKTRSDIAVIKGNTLRRYYYEIKYWIKKRDEVKKYMEQLKYPLLVIPRLGGHIKAAILTEAMPISTLRIVKILNSKINQKFLLLLFNSKLIEEFFLRYIFNYSLLTVDLDESYLRKTPFIIPNNQQPFIILADYMLFLNATEERRTLEKELIEFIDKQIIDSLVYELYFKEKFEQDGIKANLLELVESYLKDISNLSSNEQKLQTIKKVVEKIKNDKKIIEQIERIKSHPWVKIIEGRENNRER